MPKFKIVLHRAVTSCVHKIWTNRVSTMSNYKKWPEQVITLPAQELVSKLVLALSNDKKWTDRVATMSKYKK